MRKLGDKTQLKENHKISAMADIVYTENGKQYLGLPGQAFPIYYKAFIKKVTFYEWATPSYVKSLSHTVANTF